MSPLTHEWESLDPSSSKTAKLEARLTIEQKELLLEAAKMSGRSLSDFVVESAMQAAMRTLQDREIIRLSQRERERFVEGLLNPPEPGEKLRSSAERYKQRMGL